MDSLLLGDARGYLMPGGRFWGGGRGHEEKKVLIHLEIVRRVTMLSLSGESILSIPGR